MAELPPLSSYHAATAATHLSPLDQSTRVSFFYDFEAFFHPYVGALITKLNTDSIPGMLDPDFLAGLHDPVTGDYVPAGGGQTDPAGDQEIPEPSMPNTSIDVSYTGPYANYNWELLYHIPVSVAVALSSNQRFAEAQKWFHLVFDPTTTAPDPQGLPAGSRFWRSFALRSAAATLSITALLNLLETAGASDAKTALLSGYDALLTNPFQPHVVARSRPGAYQWYVVMKYLDNLIAWGDSLFLQNTIETINEAALCYVLAADILGPRPQVLPQLGVSSPLTYKQLKALGQDQLGNALVDLESQFPFDMIPAPTQAGGSDDLSGALFGIGRSLYFCVPQNPNLLAYWDTVADRLFKIRNSENIQGTAQQLPLFDPPLDPGMLVQAAAAGLDIGSIVSGLNQPLGPVRSPLLIQKALEIAAEVRSLGNALLSALEKSDAEAIALLRQSHEVTLQGLIQNVRFLQWQHAQEATTGLLKARAGVLERYTYYLRLLGLTPDPATVPQDFTLDRRELTETTFNDAYGALVAAYDKPVALQAYPQLRLAQGSSPSNQAGASGAGQLYLNQNEDIELNTHLPAARDFKIASSAGNVVASALTPIPSMEAHLAFWGIGVHSTLFSGELLAEVARIAAEVLSIKAEYEADQGRIAGQTAGYQRRSDEWLQQANLAARDLMQIGRQILGSLIAEQVASHDYQTVKAQVQQAKDVHSLIQTKFTNVAFYKWLQSEISGLYYQYYRFACDTARQAEQTMKRELMRPELDATSFIQFNYWNTGYKGLLSGEALYLDIKRMELAYHANNKRELEMVRHISLRQLDPYALITFKITGTCTLAVPEWLFDLDCPGHYLRRIKNVALSIPAVVGPYASLNCKLSLQSSSLRVSPLLADGSYGVPGANDTRFLNTYGTTDVIVTSGGSNDSGMFETNLHDERFLPFEGVGAISTWTITLPPQLRSFDYMTISDVILHLRYTARDAGSVLGDAATKELMAQMDAQSGSKQFLMFNLRYDFPTEWAAFINGTGNFTATLMTSDFPYAVQAAASVKVTGITLYAGTGGTVGSRTCDLSVLTGALGGTGSSTLNLPVDDTILVRQAAQQVFLVLTYAFG